MLCILKAVFAWLVLQFIGTNLVGFVVRGYVQPSLPVEGPTDRVRQLLEREAWHLNFRTHTMTLLAIVLGTGYLFALYRFWNIWLAASAVTLMMARLPDLIWELRTGQKVSSADAPRGTVYLCATALMWLSLPLVWYSLCIWNQNAPN